MAKAVKDKENFEIGPFFGQIFEKKTKGSLDLKDRQILYMLSLNARYSLSYISKCVGLSREVVHYRLANLVKKDILHGYMCLIDPVRFGYRKHVVFLKLKNFNEEEELINYLKNFKEITRINTCSGVWDMRLLVSTKTLEEFNNFFYKVISDIKNPVVDYLIMEQLSEHYTDLKLFVEDKRPNLAGSKRINSTAFDSMLRKPSPKEDIVNVDEIDKKILREIALDARISIKDLASKVGISQENIENRFGRLINEEIIKGMFPMISLNYLGFEWYKVLLRLKDVSHKKMQAYITSNGFMPWYVRLVGKYNYQISIFAKNSTHFHQIVNDLRKSFGDNILLFDSILIHNQFKSVERID